MLGGDDDYDDDDDEEEESRAVPEGWRGCNGSITMSLG